jgi:XXXCH domain-containing protein
MEKKDKMCFSRLELADYLQSLSEQLRRGSLESEGRQWKVPEEVWSEIKLKEKKGYIKAKISLSWSTEQEYDQATKEDLDKWKGSMKAVKKRLAASYKAIYQMAEQGKFPEQQTLAEFIESSKALGQLADPDWQEAMQVYLDHLANLQRAVEKQDFETMFHELRDLKNCMVDCHREMKYSPEKAEDIKKGSKEA